METQACAGQSAFASAEKPVVGAKARTLLSQGDYILETPGPNLCQAAVSLAAGSLEAMRFSHTWTVALPQPWEGIGQEGSDCGTDKQGITDGGCLGSCR